FSTVPNLSRLNLDFTRNFLNLERRVHALRKIAGDCPPRRHDGRALGRAANGRVDNDAGEQSLPAKFHRGGLANFRRRASLSVVQSHRGGKEIREKIRSRLAGAQNGISAGGGAIRPHSAAAASIFSVCSLFR